MEENISCPFCGEEDMDLAGLKYHLTYHCERYDETETLPPPLFSR